MRPLFLVLCLIAAPAAALELTLRETLTFGRPASLDFDPLTCTLWVANESNTVTQLAPDGREISSFTSSFFGVRALAVEPEGLILVSTAGQFTRVDRQGRPRGDAPALKGATPDVESIEPGANGTLWVVGDDPSYLVQFDAQGEELRRFDGLALSPQLSEPQGLAIDPVNNHLLITDDWEGENALFEFTVEGEFLRKISLLPYGTDPEGIAVHAQTRTLWVAFDQGQRIAVFDYEPSIGTSGAPGPDCVIGAAGGIGGASNPLR